MTVTAAYSPRPGLLGVLYAEDFDDDGVQPAFSEPHPGPEPEIIEPTFSALELDAARAEAREIGRLEAEHALAASRTRLSPARPR